MYTKFIFRVIEKVINYLYIDGTAGDFHLIFILLLQISHQIQSPKILQEDLKILLLQKQ